METIISEIFSLTIKSYEKVFESYYPAHRSNGFTERNQTFFFTHNYLKKYPESIVWQELPLKEGREHIDTLIIDTENEAILFIEAKRISKGVEEKRIQSITDDVGRMNTLCKNVFTSNNSIPQIDTKYSHYKRYILALCDVWYKGGDSRYKVFDDWQELKLNGLLKKISSEKSKILIKSEKVNEIYNLMYQLYEIDDR